MIFHRTFFALVLASATFLFTAIWGAQGVTIDPDGGHGSAATTPNPPNPPGPPLSDQGLTIDPDGSRLRRLERGRLPGCNRLPAPLPPSFSSSGGRSRPGDSST
ncbi:MAG TPA: hypothetical protein VFE33_02820 [Thermoanaerobaculia bacterium]|nr:hypothetical protein [Thermoanaerobaculia bacterium]